MRPINMEWKRSRYSLGHSPGTKATSGLFAMEPQELGMSDGSLDDEPGLAEVARVGVKHGLEDQAFETLQGTHELVVLGDQGSRVDEPDHGLQWPVKIKKMRIGSRRMKILKTVGEVQESPGQENRVI
ncbi:MFS general substrate transporter [Colletotrichum sp. SAR11_59]|nr:MFS general substrate transporter [Colletotrichum sp. SAR11_59]